MINLTKKFLKKNIKYIINIFLLKNKLKIKKKIKIKKIKFIKFGEISTNISLIISKTIKIKPIIISEFLIKNLITKKFLNKKLKYIKLDKPGFINIKYFKKLKIKFLKKILNKNKNKNKKNLIIIEFVSANPTGPLHIGHIKQAVLGNIISNIFKFRGYNIHKEFFCNDKGKQIKNLIKSIIARKNNIKPGNLNWPKDGYKGSYILKLIDKIKNNLYKNKNKLKKFCINYFLKKQKKDLKNLNIKFNYTFLESKIKKKEIIKLINILKKKNIIYKKKNKLIIKSKNLKLKKDKILKKKNLFTYLTKDLVYHKIKLKRGFNKIINIIGYDHIDIIKYIKAIINLIKKKYIRIKYIVHKMINIKKNNKNIKLSKRKGVIITLKNLKLKLNFFLKKNNLKLKKKFLLKNIINIFFISQKNLKEIKFNIKNFLKKSINLYKYIVYGNRVIKNIIYKNKNLNKLKKIRKIFNNLIIILIEYKNIIIKSKKKLEPKILLNYVILISKELIYINRNKIFLKKNLTMKEIKLLIITKKILKIILKLINLK